jgi:hypothetical protein
MFPLLVAQISSSLVQQPLQKDSARSAYSTDREDSPVRWLLDNPTVQVRHSLKFEPWVEKVKLYLRLIKH